MAQRWTSRVHDPQKAPGGSWQSPDLYQNPVHIIYLQRYGTSWFYTQINKVKQSDPLPKLVISMGWMLRWSKTAQRRASRTGDGRRRCAEKVGLGGWPVPRWHDMTWGIWWFMEKWNMVMKFEVWIWKSECIRMQQFTAFGLRLLWESWIFGQKVDGQLTSHQLVVW